MKVGIKIEGDKDVIRKLRKMGVDFEDWREGFKKVRDYLKDVFERDSFESEGAIIGKRWAPLSVAYDFAKRVRYPGRGTLVRTGTLKRGFAGDVGKLYLEMYNVVPYGKYHLTGTRRMPARVFLNVGPRQEKRIEDIISKEAEQKIKRASNA